MLGLNALRIGPLVEWTTSVQANIGWFGLPVKLRTCKHAPT
jgi:hypothetical protein